MVGEKMENINGMEIKSKRQFLNLMGLAILWKMGMDILQVSQYH